MFRLFRWLRCVRRKTKGANGAATAGDRRGTRLADDEPVSKVKIGIGALAVLALIGIHWGLSETGALSALGDEEILRRRIDGLGVWGPLALVALMIAAIVMSPIPSGPIAMVAGAAYGPVWGAVYVVIGAEAGALIAFWIARCLGYEAVRRWPGVRALLGRMGQSRSQTWLMVIVFASRLVPFISFDAVSYAAGLTPLALWRFAVATLAGVVPVSILLTYFGGELISAASEHAVIIVLLLGGITLVPVGGRLLWRWYRGRENTAAKADLRDE